MTTCEERFYAKVAPADENGCEMWQASTLKAGYSKYRVGTKTVSAHRYRFIVEKNVGIDPGPDLVIRHKCDRPGCVALEHLEPGSHTDNMRDMVERGRHRPGVVRGSEHANSKLTEPQVTEIRRRYSEGGETHRSLATEFGVSHRAVHNIVHRKHWDWLEDEQKEKQPV